VPVHVDIQHEKMIFFDEVDPISSPRKAKRVSEFGLCGVGAAIFNAIYNATGVRVRTKPDFGVQKIARISFQSLRVLPDILPD
jgi:xanthine dehydrogenase YagR molybdenum-binding subunit